MRYVDLLLPDQMGIPRGKRVTVAELEGIHRNGLLLPASMFALDVLGGTIQSTGLGFDEGDADRACLPLPGSLAPVPWLGEHIAQMQVAMYDHDRSPFFGDPRHVLEQVLGRFRQRGLRVAQRGNQDRHAQVGCARNRLESANRFQANSTVGIARELR